MLAEKPSLTITKLTDTIGAEATGVDMRRPLDAETRRALNDAVIDHVVLVIRDQHLTAAEYQAALENFGELMEDQNRRYLADGVPLISVLSNRHKDSQGRPAKQAANASWHTDHTNQERPPKFTSLYPVALPDQGGGTSVCNARAAYEALPDDMRRRIDPMQTANTLISSARAGSDAANPDIVRDQEKAAAARPPMIQPLVRTHPERGTKAIWFHQNKTENIVGMDPEETQAFLTELLEEHVLKPEFIYSHEYRLGDLLLIDNRSALHRAGFDFDHSQHRMLYRGLVRGDKPY